ncbi:MAG TPA: response regulator [Herpetosiphonaceae bacterium]
MMTEHALTHISPQSTTILIVEDDPDIQQVLNELLSACGYSLLLVESGKAALDTIERELIDLVLLDLMLPDMDGAEVCRHIRQTYGVNIPVVMLTARDQPQHVIEGLRIGADDYVPKPFMPDELLLRIERLVRRRQEFLAMASENSTLRETLQLMQHQLQAAQVETSTESLLRGELLHNVTIHLQSLVGIVEAELRKLPPGIEREAMLRVRSRVRGAALIYQMSQELQSEPVAIGQVINTIASALKAIYRPWKRITVEVVDTAVDLPSSIAAPIAMMTNELMTNCFKHAFPENRFGTIRIDYGLSDKNFTLEVGDDGVGMGHNASANGTGRATVTQLVQSLNGAVNWASSSAGTQVKIRVPLPA